MPSDFTRRLPPLGAARTVSTPTPAPRDTHDWTGEMVAVARQRDRASFMRLYDHFMPRLCLYLRGLGSPDAVAEELAQEALLRLWQRATLYDPQQGAVSTWLFRIGRNLHIDRVHLQRRIEDLPAVQARLMRMSYFEAKSHQDIADELQMPLGTVKSHLRRAFLRLQGLVRGQS
jgi:DNA-directed RNA polymerase specialized sigma24 family protein